MASPAKTPLADPLATQSAALLEKFQGSEHAARLLQSLDAALKRKARRRKKTVRRTAAGLALLAFLAWAIPYFRSTSTLETLPAHRSTFALADGSSVELNARTELQTDFRYGRRRVHLPYGEAYFAVAKDPAHPFRVITPQGTVQVTGTHFNVRVDPAGHTDVTLDEGSVNVAPSDTAAAASLAPGQAAILHSGHAEVATLSESQLAAATAWRRGRIVLDNLTLAQAARQVADYHGITLDVAPAVADLPLGGTSSLDDLARFFADLKALGKIQVTDLGEGRYVIRPR